MIPTSDFLAIRNLVLDLISRAEFCWNNQRTFDDVPLRQAAIKTFEELRSRRLPLKSDRFQAITKKATSQLKVPNGFSIYLPPLSDDPSFVPLFTFDLDSDSSKANFRLDLYNYDENSKLHHIGFRFESPTHGSKKHLFFHAQPIENVGSLVIPGASEGSKRTGTIPCLPIRADDPVSLMLCVIVSLYGTSGYVKVLSQVPIHAGFKRQMGACMDSGKEWDNNGWKRSSGSDGPA